MTLRKTSIAIVIAGAANLAGCGNERFAALDNAPPGGSQGSASPAAGARVAPPFNLAGRWTLSSPGAGSCTITLGGAQDASEGSIAPGGGCPFNFFTSRKWTFEDTGMVIRDHNAQALAQLSQAGANRLEGKATSGQVIVLSR
jgi:hypothetical protein